MKKAIISIFICLGIFLSINPATEGQTLRAVNFASDVPGITSLDPSFDPDSYSVICQIFDSLVHIDLDGKRLPGLAVSWRLVDDKTYEFKLRQGVTFHNGEVFDAASVKYTYETVIDPASRAGNAWIMNTIAAVEIINPYRIRIKLKHPDGMFLYRLSMFGAIAPVKYIQKVGLEAFKQKPVGTGPFSFVEWRKNDKIVLKKYEKYWQVGMPTIERLIFKILPENQWMEALKTGQVDVVTNLHPKYIKEIDANPDLKTMKRLVLQGYWVMLKNSGPLANLKVRQAMNYAVDKQKLIQVQGSGLGKPLVSLGKKGEIGKNPSLAGYPYNPAKAKQLMVESGYDGGFTLKALTISQATDLSHALVEDLAKIGITVNLEVVSRPEWAKRIIMGKIQGNPYDGDMAINLVDNPIIDMAFHAGLFLASPSPWSLTKDETFDKKYQYALFMAAFEKHINALKLLDKYIHDKALMLFTFQPERVFALRKGVTLPGIGINGHIDYIVFSQAQVSQ